MRNAFIDELVVLARSNPQIALIVGDLGWSVVEPFADEFPDRFLNAGVAEQNMTSMAAGMASEGYHVFTYSIANFPTFRCAEQIRNDVDYHKLPVTVVAVGGGVAYGNLGYSHHAVQDYALMRSLPNMLIASPGDPMEVRACLRYLVSNPQPSYLRLGKAGEPQYHNEVPVISPGEWVILDKGQSSNTFLTTGATLQLAMEAKQKLRDYCDHGVASLPLWGMRYKSMISEMVGGFERVHILEDHFQDGGFGSWVVEGLMSQPELVQRISANHLSRDVYDIVAKSDTLWKRGLSNL
jgi:transketolase